MSDLEPAEVNRKTPGEYSGLGPDPKELLPKVYSAYMYQATFSSERSLKRSRFITCFCLPVKSKFYKPCCVPVTLIVRFGLDPAKENYLPVTAQTDTYTFQNL